MNRSNYCLWLTAALCLALPALADDDDDKKDNPKAGAKVETHDAGKSGGKSGATDDAKEGAKPEASDAVVSVAVLKGTTQTAPVEGTATVLSPDTLIQLDADIRAARLAADFSKALLVRAETLFRDKVTVSRQDMETAARQSAADALQLTVLDQRMRMAFGEAAPLSDKDKRAELMAKLSKGEVIIVRLDFPGAEIASPRNIKIMALSGGAAVAVETVWPAPQGNLALPGAAFVTFVRSAPGLRQGDRARATADAGEAKSSVIVPHGAIVITEGRAWCFIEKKPGKFVRRPVSLENPVEGGYLVKSGFAEGDKAVVRGAGHLLAREAGPGDDDDDK